MVGVVRGIARQTDISGQNRHQAVGIPLGQRAFAAGETAVEGNTLGESKRHVAIQTGRRLVRALGHPHRITILTRRQSGLQVGECARPRRSVVCSRGVRIHIPDRRRPREHGGDGVVLIHYEIQRVVCGQHIAGPPGEDVPIGSESGHGDGRAVGMPPIARADAPVWPGLGVEVVIVRVPDCELFRLRHKEVGVTGSRESEHRAVACQVCRTPCVGAIGRRNRINGNPVHPVRGVLDRDIPAAAAPITVGRPLNLDATFVDLGSHRRQRDNRRLAATRGPRVVRCHKPIQSIVLVGEACDAVMNDIREVPA